MSAERGRVERTVPIGNHRVETTMRTVPRSETSAMRGWRQAATVPGGRDERRAGVETSSHRAGEWRRAPCGGGVEDR
ncbi:hypothetical protein GUJ93_ZPchr0008g13954 [Zizania palustris]|uniref:Uncharacterized protein n=1 Tax=Zizania palustris TaxID=103762 RepID=A0A8J5RD00_ZIZPA|nr:hypothetical protein GUJ93_ZPchr0008g13954 [Zizania palustris]